MSEQTRHSHRNLLGIGAMIVAVAFAVGTLAFLIAGGDNSDSPPEDIGLIDQHRPEEGEIAPDFALVDVRDGETVRRLSDFRGKVVVLNWYASWCAPCAAEIPEFQAAQDALPDDVVFLLVNLQQDRGTAERFLDDLDATLIAVLDSDGVIADHYRVVRMPTTYFIDRDGRVSIGASGMVTEDALRTELAKLGLEY